MGPLKALNDTKKLVLNEHAVMPLVGGQGGSQPTWYMGANQIRGTDYANDYILEVGNLGDTEAVDNADFNALEA